MTVFPTLTDLKISIHCRKMSPDARVVSQLNDARVPSGQLLERDLGRLLLWLSVVVSSRRDHGIIVVM